MTSTRPPQKYAPYVFFCWLYIGLGTGSLAAGAYLLAVPRLFTGPGSSDPLQTIIAVILLVFGVARIAVAVYNLRRPSRRPK